jgi:hypothetical protein
MNNLFKNLTLSCEERIEFIPEHIPVSAVDVDRNPPMSMDIPMSDNCPSCGGNNMKVGDYVCWGVCYNCMNGN